MSPRRTPGPIRCGLSLWQYVRHLLQQQVTGIMGPGVRRDDNLYLRSTAIVRLAKVRRSAMTETK